MRGLPALRSSGAEREGRLPSGCPVRGPPSFLPALLCLLPTPVLSTVITRESLGPGGGAGLGPNVQKVWETWVNLLTDAQCTGAPTLTLTIAWI